MATLRDLHAVLLVESNGMINPSSIVLTDRFDPFLHATVVDAHGSEASMLSILARLDLDAWEIARELAGMSKPAAHQRLTTIVAGRHPRELRFDLLDWTLYLDQLPDNCVVRVTRRPLLVAYVFLAMNALFFVLLCWSMVAPIPGGIGRGDAAKQFAGDLPSYKDPSDFLLRTGARRLRAVGSK